MYLFFMKICFIETCNSVIAVVCKWISMCFKHFSVLTLIMGNIDSHDQREPKVFGILIYRGLETQKLENLGAGPTE